MANIVMKVNGEIEVVESITTGDFVLITNETREICNDLVVLLCSTDRISWKYYHPAYLGNLEGAETVRKLFWEWLPKVTEKSKK
jgi:hypothetical protein